MKRFYVVLVIIMFTCVVAILPMGLSPQWNGVDAGHRNQYELLADSIINGKVTLEYDSSYTKDLKKIENPYDPELRDKTGVRYKWDHAYYKGKYYMYFGVVPVVLTFIPYKLITGTSLNTYHATQIYVCIFIVGIFFLFEMLRKLTKSKISTFEYVLASIAISLASIWYAIDYPALYTTAITSGLCLSIWSIIFYIKTIFEEKHKIRNILIAGLLGALIFGCRPTIGFTNILFIPALLSLIKKENKGNKVLLTVLSMMPFIFVAFILMLYNYIRFDSFFEFGQTYQLTCFDQTNMMKETMQPSHIIESLRMLFFYNEGVGDKFPYIRYLGLFLNYPVLLFPLIILIDKEFRNKLKSNKLVSTYTCILIAIVITSLSMVLMVPYIIVRYQMDIVYLFGILLYISYVLLGINKKRRAVFIVIFIDMIIKTFLLYMIPDMYNYPSYLYGLIK